jgi:2-polyprenyl-3-methyl-5-hydroxy-6-metoxy-1,4-benzoquinol methylase
MEYRRFAPGESPVSTFEFHEHRERAPHLEQEIHRARLQCAAYYVARASGGITPCRVVDLGCGDGGLVSVLVNVGGLDVYGYDFQPSNVAGWVERGVEHRCRAMDFVANFDAIANICGAHVYVMTEVLEHMEDPHGFLRRVRKTGASLVCSSPWMEHEGNIDACHAWAWDTPGYVAMLEGAGFKIIGTSREGIFQVHLAVPSGE